MPLGLIAKKLGMTQVYDEAGSIIPVTVLQAGPCVVVDRRTDDRDGYPAVQLGLVEARPIKRVTKPLAGHYKKAGVPPCRVLRELPVGPDEDIALGAQVLVQNTFETGEKVDVSGVSKGKGFQGVIKRHGFSGGGASHGSMFHRAPGSIGQASYPSRVFRGQKMPGQTGNKRITARNLTVVRIDEERNLLLVKGAVPGANGGYLTVQKAGS